MEHTAATEDRAVRVSTLELFFDLVFVFTLTQLTGLLAAEPDWDGLLKVVLLFSVIWWIYDPSAPRSRRPSRSPPSRRSWRRP